MPRRMQFPTDATGGWDPTGLVPPIDGGCDRCKRARVSPPFYKLLSRIEYSTSFLLLKLLFLCEKVVKSIAARVAKAKVFLSFAGAPYCLSCVVGGQGASPHVGSLGGGHWNPHGGSIPAPNRLLQCRFVKRRALQTACRNALCGPAATSQSALTCTHTTPSLAIHLHVLAGMASRQSLQQSKALDQWECGIFIGTLQNDSNNRLDLRTCINPAFKSNLSQFNFKSNLSFHHNPSLQRPSLVDLTSWHALSCNGRAACTVAHAKPLHNAPPTTASRLSHGPVCANCKHAHEVGVEVGWAATSPPGMQRAAKPGRRRVCRVTDL